MSSPEADVDLRNYPRVSADCEVSYQVVPESGQPDTVTGYASNISGGGLCFTSLEPLPEGRMIALQVHVPQLPSRVVSLARVVWSRPQEGTGRYENGVEFWWLGWSSDDAQSAMLDYVNSSLEQGEGE